MCLKCHERLGDESVIHQIKEALKKPDFNNSDTTSFMFLFLAYSGVNGSEAQDLAYQFFEELIKWSKSNDLPANSYRTMGDCTMFEASPCIDDIKKQYLNMKNYPNLKIELSEIPQRREAVFHQDFMNQFDPEPIS